MGDIAGERAIQRIVDKWNALVDSITDGSSDADVSNAAKAYVAAISVKKIEMSDSVKGVTS